MQFKNSVLTKQMKKIISSIMASVALTASSFAAPLTDVLDESHPDVQMILAVQEKVTPTLMQREEVLGTAVGVDETTNSPTLIVLVNKNVSDPAGVERDIVRVVGGQANVKVIVTDEIKAMGHTAKQTPPIRLGTSGGWTYDEPSNNSFCCVGTLGSLVLINGAQYILSNWHVLEGDTVLGDNNRIEQNGDPVLQPGLLDENCNRTLSNIVGYVVKRHSLPTSNVDVGIARVRGGYVRTDGSILGIGTICKTYAGPYLNQTVKKSGRTTGLTHSHVVGINGTVRVAYNFECGSTGIWYKTFTGQIFISNSNSSFLNHGDSGSLMVEEKVTNPRPIGLLFAASTTVAFANPIRQVLTFLGATMVGQNCNAHDWSGTVSGNWHAFNCSIPATATMTMHMTVAEGTGAVSGPATLNGVPCINDSCGVNDYPNSTGSVSGTVTGTTISLTYTGTAQSGVCDGQTVSIHFTGTISDTTISSSGGSLTISLHRLN